MNNASNDFWKAEQYPTTFESGKYRFRDEMLPLFYRYLNITPESQVLDGGCGTGVLTRFLAKGLTSGHITGFELNTGFVNYGKEQIKKLGMEDRVTLEEGDGFNLRYPDNRFDAVTNYRYVGVLSDPEAGMRELIRVCKPGGTVSCVIATNSVQSIHWQGGYPFEGAEELQNLATRENVIFTNFSRNPLDFKQSLKWNDHAYPKLFEVCGLKEIHLFPFSYLFCYNDMDLPMQKRKELAVGDTMDEIEWMKYRYQGKEEIYKNYGFSPADFERLVDLLHIKADYLNAHFETDHSYEWRGGYNFIVTGVKPD